MKKYTWNEIIKDKTIKNLNLIGYGSLLNRHTLTEEVNLKKVIVKGYKRVYNCSYTNEQLTKKRMDNFIFLSNKLFENPNEEKNIISYPDNSGTLNVIKEENSIFNGLLQKIDRTEFSNYAERESKYYLQEVEYSFEGIDEDNKERAFLVIIPNNELDTTEICYIYDKLCRNGAYEHGLEFGTLYDNTTYYKGELSYKFILNKYFPIGKKIKITNIMNTLLKYNGEKENLIKKHNEEGIVIGYHKTDIKILLENGENVYFDMGDIS